MSAIITADMPMPPPGGVRRGCSGEYKLMKLRDCPLNNGKTFDTPDKVYEMWKEHIPTARLAAIHAFFNYLAGIDPRHIAPAQTIVAVPFKRQSHRVAEYLERDEVLKIFASIDGRTWQGQRDDALLRLLYNTGMRVQELVDLDVSHLRFSHPYTVRIHGKGRERTCPLWKETIAAIKAHLEKRGVRLNDATPLFVNRGSSRLTRFGVRHIITHRVAGAANACPSLLTRRVPPHTWRHTTAMHLLQSNVDLNMIRSWLGHASIETTNSYVESIWK